MSAYRKNFDETKYLSFLIKDDELLENYNENWEKIKNSLRKFFDNKPVYNEKHLKAKQNPITEKSIQIFMLINAKRRFSINLFISNFE